MLESTQYKSMKGFEKNHIFENSNNTLEDYELDFLNLIKNGVNPYLNKEEYRDLICGIEEGNWVDIIRYPYLNGLYALEAMVIKVGDNYFRLPKYKYSMIDMEKYGCADVFTTDEDGFSEEDEWDTGSVRIEKVNPVEVNTTIFGWKSVYENDDVVNIEEILQRAKQYGLDKKMNVFIEGYVKRRLKEYIKSSLEISEKRAVCMRDYFYNKHNNNFNLVDIVLDIKDNVEQIVSMMRFDSVV